MYRCCTSIVHCWYKLEAYKHSFSFFWGKQEKLTQKNKCLYTPFLVWSGRRGEHPRLLPAFSPSWGLVAYGLSGKGKPEGPGTSWPYIRHTFSSVPECDSPFLSATAFLSNSQIIVCSTATMLVIPHGIFVSVRQHTSAHTLLLTSPDSRTRSLKGGNSLWIMNRHQHYKFL